LARFTIRWRSSASGALKKAMDVYVARQAAGSLAPRHEMQSALDQILSPFSKLVMA